LSCRASVRVLVLLSVIVAMCSGAALPSRASGAAGQDQASARSGAASASSGYPLPQTPAQPAHLAVIGGNASAQLAAATAAAERQAQDSGRPVVIAGATTATTTIAAEPDGMLSLSEYVLPVRVRRGAGWVPVSTTLRRNADGSLSPAAVPGDQVSFSGGGSAPMATLAADGTSVALRWPGSLPAPVISGSSATYRNVLPGVDLVLTATSAVSGGFSQTLVVHDAAAARNPALASLKLGVSTRGVGLTAGKDGALLAVGSRSGGYYAAPPALMWDSSAVSPAAGSAASAAAARAARAVGAALAPPGLAGPVSSPAGPAAGSRLAAVSVGVARDGAGLSLVPDKAMLSAASTKFPVYVDPSWQWYTVDGDRQNYDEVQSACPTASHYNTTDSAYWSLGVGYDGFGDCNGANGYAYSYYSVAVPSKIWGAHLNTATVNAQEAYTASCSASADVTLSWSGAINSGTDWNNQPGVDANQSTVDVGPSTESCNSTFDTSSSAWLGVGFSVLSAMGKAASGHWTNFTFRLWEQSNSNDVDWKRFGKNPYLQVTYNDTPAVPSAEKATANSDGSASAGCDTTDSSPPSIGAISGNGPYLWAHYDDVDGDSVQGTVRYWKPATSPTYNTLTTASDLPSGGATVSVAIPSSFYSGLSNGQVIAWDSDATNGKYTSGWSSTCYFTAWPKAPAAPVLSAPVPGASCPGGVITAGCQVTFTITASANDPATEFVWRLDNYPATSSPPSSEILTASGSPASAQLTITVPTPGPHNLWVYASDAGSNDSGDTDGASGGDTTLVAAGDPAVSCPSFADALANECSGPSAPNNLISKASGSPLSCGTTIGDGAGRQLDAAELTKAGWGSGSHLTVDGASFTLPAFGSCQNDNVLAANQTISEPAGTQGSAVVFLATSTNSFGAVPGLTGSQDAGVLAADTTVPAVPGGIEASGGGCTAATEEDANATGCEPATGTVNYVAGCPEAQTTYYLSVPDWTAGPADISAVTIADRDLQTGQQAVPSKIFAFAAPTYPGCQIASVTLPDIGTTVSSPVTATANAEVSGLHIFGMSVRNTTTATPETDGASAAAPAGQSWTGGWASPAEDAHDSPFGAAWGNQTLRIETPVSVGGGDVRIRLTNPGFLSQDGDAPLQIGHATIAVASAAGSPVPAAAPVPLSFGVGGSQSATIPDGGDVYSNPAGLTVTPGEDLLVSLYVSNAAGSLPYLPDHGAAGTSPEWVTAAGASAGAGDHTTDTTGTPFTSGKASGDVHLLTGVDITTAQTAADPGGTPTVSVVGMNTIDGNYGSVTTVANAVRVDLGLAAATAGTFGVVNGGTNSNQASADSTQASGYGGVSAVARLDRDVLAEPGIGTVIIDEGLQDVLHGASEQQLEDAYGAMITELSAFGVNVIITTITPCGGYSNSAAGDSCSTAVDGDRTDVNQNFVENVAPPNCWADLDAAVSNGAAPEALSTADGTGDHVNLSQAGYTALTGAVTSGGCSLAANQLPAP
jgi:hypothetical protein